MADGDNNKKRVIAIYQHHYATVAGEGTEQK